MAKELKAQNQVVLDTCDSKSKFFAIGFLFSDKLL